MNEDDGQLDRLDETIVRLRARIEQYGDHIGGHETRTRVILIDPLLRSLGWDTEDPEMVVHEHRVGSLKVDYALFSEKMLIGILEAKALGSKLNDADLVKYVDELPRVPVIAFTDGDEWRFFWWKSNGRRREIVRVSSGESFRTGWEFNQKIGRVVVQRQYPGPPDNPDTEVEREWYPLCDQMPDSHPRWVRMGETAPTEWASWRRLYVDVAKYLVSSGDIRPSDLPIWVTKGQKWAINHEPTGPDGEPFISRALIGPDMWLEAHGNPKTHRDYSCRLLRRFHSYPESVQVCFD